MSALKNTKVETKSLGTPTTDPVADMLTRVRNASLARHESVQMAVSKLRLAIAKILKEEGFVTDFEVLRGKPQRMLKIVLRYDEKRRPFITGIERMSKPGLRLYVGANEIPRVYGGLGVSIVSTPKGVITGKQAWRDKVGGELLCNVW